MKRHTRNTLAALTAITAIASLVVPAYAVDFNVNLGSHPDVEVQNNDAVQIDHRALDHIRGARRAIEHGDRDEAMHEVERAKTELMHAQSVGDVNAPRALDEVREAEHRLRDHEHDRAMASLDHAADMLHI